MTIQNSSAAPPDATSQGHKTEPNEEPPVIPLRHPVRNILTVLLVASVIIVGYSVATNSRFQWLTVLEYLFNPQILTGLGNTLVLTVVGMVIGIILGLLLAIMRLSSTKIAQLLAGAYIWFFRGTPVLVQLIFWYNFGALYPRIFGLQANDLITPLTAAILGLGLNQAAYIAEVVRGGIISVGKGQREAAQAVGMTPGLIYRRIILPQAMPAIIPPVGNEFITLLKNTSLVSVIAMADLLHSAQLIYARTYETIPLLIVVCIWYLVVTTVLTLAQGRVERHFAGR
ncbi:MAG: amino acid ABC transporter permease [Gulosibacter sp.]|uniref:amino acid ABC transporter permease n=1 Tax=Gulosibacter sp. TaxID=2817531 RepID=UPI003F8E6BEB